MPRDARAMITITNEQSTMSPWTTYRRTLALLASERWLAAGLGTAGCVVAIVQVIEQQLFGWVVDALAKGSGAFPIIGLWAALGLGGIVASVVVSVASDRMAHRRRPGPGEKERCGGWDRGRAARGRPCAPRSRRGSAG